MVKVVPILHVRGAPARQPAHPLVMRWLLTPDGLRCLWEAGEADWFAPAATRPLAKARVAPRRLLRRLARRQRAA